MAIDGINGLANAPLIGINGFIPQQNNPPCANLLHRFPCSICAGCVGFLGASALVYYGVASLVNNRLSVPAGILIIGVGIFICCGLLVIGKLSLSQN